MLLQTSSPSGDPRRPAERHLLAWWSLFTMQAVTAYCSSLVAHLTAPHFPPPFETIQQLVRAGVYWGFYIPLPLESVLDFDRPGQEEFAARMVLVRDAEDVTRRLRRGDYAVPSMSFGRYVFVEEQLLLPEDMRRLRMISECAKYDLLSLYLRPHSPLTPWINRVIERLVEGGVLEHWQTHLILRGRVSAVLAGSAGDAAAAAEAATVAPQPLRLPNLAPAFMLLAAGCALAALCCAAELARNCHRRRRQPRAAAAAQLRAVGRWLRARRLCSA
ncbi:hypothetical protein R5R35_010410 [Gryllus longicercus]|uniref:Ionotropic glutamate receptor C-terminal domain-containing protein n=1 Tax=Gryllus longicercus TaxID=2509291 RepID=A0AAN9Z8C4_9ORTH